MGGSAEPSRQTPLKVAVKQVIVSASHLTSRARMMPSFLLAGAQRCGTTTLHLALRAHPNVVLHRLYKGVNYFDVNYARGEEWYRAHFPLQPYARARTALSGRPTITGEASGYYMFHPLAAERIGADLPGVKLIAMVRDPVERAYSAHRHEFARGFETEPFERALELEPTRLAGEVERMRSDPAYESFSHRHHAYVTRGRYAEQLSTLVEHCGRDNVFVLDADAFFAEPTTHYRRVLAFLGLPDHESPLRKTNAQPGAPLPASLAHRLREEFAVHDEALVPFLGDLPSWRR
ncbi:MAG: sulfotransferase domain-containing protein [Actinomycetes bacterium]